MAVNEGDNHAKTFICGSKEAFVNNVVLFSDGPPLPDFMYPNDLDESELLVDQQSARR